MSANTLKLFLTVFLCYLAHSAQGDRSHLRISGGNPATIENYNYLVQIRVPGKPLCGGCIISRDWVVTAASCIAGVSALDVAVRAGTPLLDQGGVVKRVDLIEKHSLYNPKDYNYNFALIRVSSPFSFTDTNINAAKVPLEYENLPMIGPYKLAGWGSTSDSTTDYSQTLTEVRVATVPKKTCSLIYSGKVNLTDTTFCLGKLLITTKGSCQGDTGGPAIYNNVIVGVMSYRETCGSRYYPAIYSKISTVVNWIKGVTGII